MTQAQSTPPRAARGSWAMRDYPVALWLLAALVVAIGHGQFPDPDWLLLHIVLLGALSQAIVVWSWHFAQTMLHLPDVAGGRRRQAWRLVVLNVGAVLVLIGIPTGLPWLAASGATLVAAVAVWHGWAIWQLLRKALPARFRVSVHYYLAAAGSLLVGASLGGSLAYFDEGEVHARLLVAHALTNVLGWVGFTLTGTLLTLWPTMLRTRMDDRAELWTRRALPGFVAALVVALVGALLGWPPLVAFGVVAYLVALALWGRGLWEPLRNRPPEEFGPASVAAGLAWLTTGVALVAWELATNREWEEIDEAFAWPAAMFAGGLLQVLLGALSYLLPSVLGGGPSVVRAGQAWLNRWRWARLAVYNVGLLLWLSPVPTTLQLGAAALTVLAAATFLPLAALGMRASLLARSTRDQQSAP